MSRARSHLCVAYAGIAVLAFVGTWTHMVIEARKLGIRWVWAYVVLGFLVAISVTFPLFLIARERRLASPGDAARDLRLSTGDLAALVGLGGATAAITFWTLVQ
jgi:hypothetical protein